jgi:YHS domain-containing protein
MSPEFIRCEHCKIKIPSKVCELATYRMVIDGKEYIFCCEKCTRNHKKKTTSTTK